VQIFRCERPPTPIQNGVARDALNARASTISSMAWVNLVKLRVVPDVALVALKLTLSVPKKLRSVEVIDPLMQPWPDGCSG
jgi:hypothetical protein